MRRKAKLLLALGASVAGLAALAACGGGGSSTTTVTSIVITPEQTNVPLNTSTNITAVVNLSNTAVTTSTAVTFLINTAACTTVGPQCPAGTIVPSPTNPQVGVYTAPMTAPGVNNNTVSITATAPRDPSSTTDTSVVTSNIVALTIGSGLGLAIVQGTADVPALGAFQFSATLNSVADPNARWAVTQVPGVDVGAIDPVSGLYAAPAFPPPGGTVTITATDMSAPSPANATVKIVYSDGSLKGPFAFAYSGGTGSSFQAIAGSFVTDGQGNILSGVEDVDSFATGVRTRVPIFSGNYLVGPDGCVNATLNTGLQAGTTWEFALTSNKHAQMIRFDKSNTASGTIDQQNLDDLTNSLSVISGPYVLGVSGFDAGLHPLGVAGRFSSDAAGGIPLGNTIVDMNDNGSVTPADRTLHGTYSFDAANPGTGRGTLTLTSTATGQIQYAFYIVDSTHLRLVEIDANDFLAGDAFSSPAGNSFTAGSLAKANFLFTAVGTSGAGAYAAGGVFASDGGGNITGGAFDVNNAGSVPASAALGSCAYTVDSTTGRVDLKLFSGSGACPAGPSASLAEYAAYQTAQGTAVMLELDANAITSGLAFQQQSTSTLPLGSFAVGLATRGVGQDSPNSVEQDATGSIALSGATGAAGAGLTSGNLDINDFDAVFQSDPASASASSIGTPDSNGRGTAILNATDPTVTFNLIYYIIDSSRALLLGSDTTRVGSGIVARQF